MESPYSAARLPAVLLSGGSSFLNTVFLNCALYRGIVTSKPSSVYVTTILAQRVFAFRRIRSDPFTFTFVHAMGGGVDVANAAAPDASITTVPFESSVICRYSNTL
jgi:hypothetical protein